METRFPHIDPEPAPQRRAHGFSICGSIIIGSAFWLSLLIVGLF